MNFIKMYQMQKELDSRIRKEHHLENVDVLNEKVLAFQVELGELANETRCFKYWSVKPPSHREVILEEYVDGIHFLLSMGLDLNYEMKPHRDDVCSLELTLQFVKLFELSGIFGKSRSEEDYLTLFNEYLLLGKKLNFTTAEIEAAYVGKNTVNHQRQDTGY